MKKSVLERMKVLGLAASLALTTTNCSSLRPPAGGGGAGNGAPAPVKSALAYVGSGSDWTWSLNSDGTFSAHELSKNVDVQGTYARLATGFLKITVTGGAGADAPPVGAQAYGLEIPGVALLLKPILSFEHEIITLVAGGDCPQSDIAGNWILTQHHIGVDMQDASKDAFGTFAFNLAQSAVSLPSRYALQGYTSLGGDPGPYAGNCSGGIITVNGGNGGQVKMYLTKSGAAIVKFENDGGGALVMPTAKISMASALAGSYAGLVFESNADPTQNSLTPFQATFAQNGLSAQLQGLTDVESAQPNDQTGTLNVSAIDQPSDGFVEGTVVSGLKTGKVACTAAINVLGSGKNIMFCTGQAPGDASQAENALFVSK